MNYFSTLTKHLLLKKYKYYLFPAIGFILLFSCLSIIIVTQLVKYNATILLNEKIENGKQQVKIIQSLISNSIEKNDSEEKIREAIQKAIQNTNNLSVFLSLLDWSGNIICHPDITKIGSKSPQKGSVSNSFENTVNGKELFSYLTKENSKDESIIFYITSLQKSNWIISVHLNKKTSLEQIIDFRLKAYQFLFVLGLILLLFTLVALKRLNGVYEKISALRNTKIEDDLGKLNDSLANYQSNLSKIAETTLTKGEEDTSKSNEENTKERILTYRRNELMSVITKDIAYMYVDNTVTHVVQNDGKHSISNEGLDTIFSNLNEKSFFKVNRQIVVSISAIDKIIKYDNNTLKIQVNPKSEIDVIIGKNKAAAFKKWLDF